MSIAKEKVRRTDKHKKDNTFSNKNISTSTFENSMQRGNHHMSAYSWSDPVNTDASPGSYNIDSLIGKESLVKNNSPSFTFGVTYNYKKM